MNTASQLLDRLNFLWSYYRSLWATSHKIGYWPNFRHPRSFNEKIGHFKHFVTRDPKVMVQTAMMADKFLVRDYVWQTIGEEYLKKLYYVCDTDPQDIPFDDLPQSFVIKMTHGSGWNILVPDKENFDRSVAVEKCRHWMKSTYKGGIKKQEIWYSKIHPRILVEEFLTDEDKKIPRDYKFYVFHGQVKVIQVDMDRFTDHKRTLYDCEWNRLDFSYFYPNTQDVPRPLYLEEMTNIAEQLGRNLPFVRVDLYEIPKRVVFGEMTFAPEGGRGRITPKEWDFQLGSYWNTTA